MRDEIQINRSELMSFRHSSSCESQVDDLLSILERDGLVALPQLLQPQTLQRLQEAFAARLQRVRWNHFEGYQMTEPYRHMVEDLLILDHGFVDLVLHPLVKGVLNRYLGEQYELTEAKGWKSLPTKRDFHGWHADAWYEEDSARQIHKEVKLAIYLTDVRSGAFNYLKGSHRKQHPRLFQNSEVKDVPASQITEMLGPAGTAFLFDTSGIHRQGVPMLEERQACFFNYHDPNVALLQEAVDYYRYHPLILNAAFLGGLSEEDRRILGFGNMTNFQPAFLRSEQPSFFYKALSAAYNAELRVKKLKEMIGARVRRTLG
jgi:hypothetical protein